MDYNNYFARLILASSICSLSFINNNQEGIIGSMIISPIATSIILSKTNIKESVVLLIVSVAICVIIGWMSGYFTKDIINIQSNQMINRSQKFNKITTLLVTIIIGLTYAFEDFKIMGINSFDLIGSAIAISVLPPLINTGILYHEGRYENAVNAFEFGSYNIMGIYIALFITSLIYSKN